MSVLEQIQQMKMQGIPKEEIIGSLQQQGVSPREIQDAMNQAEIKNAVEGDMYTENYEDTPMQGGSQEYEEYSPQQETTQNYPQEYQGQQEGGYQEYGNYQNYESGNTDNMIEIAEQVFEDKNKMVDKKINALNEFKTLTETKLEIFESRLKRIENLIDQLQIKILERIGNYGKDLDKTKKEVEMVQDSFGKMVNDIADKSDSKSKKK